MRIMARQIDFGIAQIIQKIVQIVQVIVAVHCDLKILILKHKMMLNVGEVMVVVMLLLTISLSNDNQTTEHRATRTTSCITHNSY